MSQNTPSEAQTIQRWIKDRFRDLRGAMPGIVVTYYPGTSVLRATADIQPCLMETLPGLTPAPLPILPMVPIIYPGTKTFALQFPLLPGDGVMLVFNDKSIDSWYMGSGGIVDPQDTRQHDLSDAVAIPGFFSSKIPSPAATYEGSVALTYKDPTGALTGTVLIDPLGNITLMNGAAAVIRLGSLTAARPTVPVDLLAAAMNALYMIVTDWSDATNELTTALSTDPGLTPATQAQAVILMGKTVTFRTEYEAWKNTFAAAVANPKVLL